MLFKAFFIFFSSLSKKKIYLVLTKSSIFNIIHVVSVASLIAELVTNNGCTTFSSERSVIVPLFTLIPVYISPSACLLRNSVTTDIGFNPAFSAKVYGITLSASANALTQYASEPPNVLAHFSNCIATSISGAPPPTRRYFSLTNDLTTQRASCNDLSASSTTSLLDPLTKTETVFPNFGTPVILTILPPGVFT